MEMAKRGQEMQELSQRLERLSQDRELAMTKESAVKEDIMRHVATVRIHKDEMDDIYDRLFESQIGCLVDEHLTKWEYGLQDIQQKIHLLEQSILEQENGLNSLSDDRERLQIQLERKKIDLSEVERSLNEIESRSLKIIEDVNLEGIRLNAKDIIYAKEESVRMLLKEKVDYFFEKKDALLREEFETMSRAVMKDVMHPSLVRLYGKLQEQVDYLIQGQEYLQMLEETTGRSGHELMDRYPLLP